MNLRKAAFLAVLGLGYTVLHKVVYGLIPALRSSPAAHAVTSVLGLAAALALILFAYEFLRELSPRGRRLRYSLVSIIAFTGLLIVSKLPLALISDARLGVRLFSRIFALCNSLAVLTFMVSFGGFVARSSPLWVPLRGSIWAVCATAVLGFVSTGYLVFYALTGREADPLPFLRPLAVLVFLLTYGMTTWFLIRFWRMDTYQGFIGL
jgi:hypothetical protein